MRDLGFTGRVARQQQRDLGARHETIRFTPPTNLERCELHPHESLGPYGCRTCNGIAKARKRLPR